jgi:O-antigen/teichoic acid export membrane protein
MKSFKSVLRSAGMNWLALLAGMIVTFLLSPVIVHRLGNTLYGVWSLIIATMSYLALLDMGLRGAITRYVARDLNNKDYGGVEKTIASGLALRLLTAAVIIATAAVLAIALPGLLHVPAELHRATSIALMIAGGTLASQMVGGVFGAVLASEHRFDVISWITILQTVLRASTVYTVLIMNRGIVAVAVCEFATVGLSTFLLLWFAKRQLPQVSFRLMRPERSMLNEIWRFSSGVFLINICQQVIYYTDNLVIGTVISAAAVTFYTIGGSLIEYVRQIVSSLTTTMMPLASRLDAAGDKAQLKSLLVRGAQASLLIALPISVTLAIRGKEFISIWMGAQYAPVSGTVLQILAVSTVFVAANAAGTNVLYGTSNHGKWAKYVTFEAIANLFVSILFCLKYGVIGVAVGTAIPSLIVNLFLLPRHLTRVTGVSLAEYYFGAWGRPLLASLPFAAVSFWLQRRRQATSLLQLFIDICCCLTVYLLASGLVFAPEVQRLIGMRNRSSVANAV